MELLKALLEFADLRARVAPAQHRVLLGRLVGEGSSEGSAGGRDAEGFGAGGPSGPAAGVGDVAGLPSPEEAVGGAEGAVGEGAVDSGEPEAEAEGVAGPGAIVWGAVAEGVGRARSSGFSSGRESVATAPARATTTTAPTDTPRIAARRLRAERAAVRLGRSAEGGGVMSGASGSSSPSAA